MTSEPITFHVVWELCTKNNRVVPRPANWNHLYSILTGKIQKASGGWTPPLPLILAAWHETSEPEKQVRLRLHIEWAQQQGQLEQVFRFLESLPEREWCHQGEC